MQTKSEVKVVTSVKIEVELTYDEVRELYEDLKLAGMKISETGGRFKFHLGEIIEEMEEVE